MNAYALDDPRAHLDSQTSHPVLDMRYAKRAEFRQLLQRRWPHPCVLGVALAVSELLSSNPLVADPESVSFNPWLWCLMTLAARVLTPLLVMLTVTIAQVGLPCGAGWRRLILVFAAIAISVAFSAAQTTNLWHASMGLNDLSGDARLALFLFQFWINAVFSILLVILYEWQLRVDQVMAAVRDARIAEEALETQTLDARLNGMKARVDPEFLFTVIANAGVLYRVDINAGERLLEQLIDFLRATLPRHADSRMTLGSEMRLSEAYLALESTMRRDSLSFRTTADRVALAARFPPLVLLPLLRTLLPSKLPEEPSASLLISVVIEARRQLSRLEVNMTCGATSQSAPYLLARSRQSEATAKAALRTFFGADANVSIRVRASDGYTVTVDVPFIPYMSEVPHVAS